MSLTIHPDPWPLRVDADGVVRISETRIPLERVINGYWDGQTPEDIVSDFDVLRVADVYAVIGYYLNHRDEVDAYLRQREEQAEEMRRMIETVQPPRPNLREELLARLARREKGDAPAGQ
jgi:uncharacterized protein (DUF433 family)